MKRARECSGSWHSPVGGYPTVVRLERALGEEHSPDLMVRERMLFPLIASHSRRNLVDPL